jgi:hypothetical protein
MDKETLKMFSELLDSKLGDLERRLDYKLDKITMALEDLTCKFDVIEEVQKSHIEQNENDDNDIVKKLTEKIDIMELSIKDILRDVKENKNVLFNVELITSSNWNEIIKLKAVR